ncbi:ensconsin isoform X2 [Drosophila virilis]|nr:ensconsin isoform X3 [Drosophila virilis]
MAGEEDGDEIDDTTLRAKLVRLCPHYEKLSDIFSVRKEMEVVGRESLESRSSLDMLHCEDESTTEPLFTSGIEDLSQVASMDANRRKFQEDRLWVERETLKLQQEQFLWAKEVEERKMRLEEQQFKLEERRIALEEQRREADFQLKQLELELKYFFSLKAFH